MSTSHGKGWRSITGWERELSKYSLALPVVWKGSRSFCVLYEKVEFSWPNRWPEEVAANRFKGDQGLWSNLPRQKASFISWIYSQVVAEVDWVSNKNLQFLMKLRTDDQVMNPSFPWCLNAWDFPQATASHLPYIIEQQAPEPYVMVRRSMFSVIWKNYIWKKLQAESLSR